MLISYATKEKKAEAIAVQQSAAEQEAQGMSKEAEAERMEMIRICKEIRAEMREINPDGHWCVPYSTSMCSGIDRGVGRTACLLLLRISSMSIMGILRCVGY